ncbi:MAG: DNA mismatch endonuclease Vsr [Chloroflexota bacterium]|nr:DNA mismatch endonuclease Vsr [Chloroflexota bacterium]
MADVHSKKQRSYNMSKIRGKDTKPEKLVRSLLHKNGYRFRLHLKDLPGKPDIVLPRHNKIVEVRGCFWHMHDCKYGRVKPKTNADFWEKKRLRTKHRDQENLNALVSLGWKTLIVWECECKDLDQLENKLLDFMG